MNRIIVGTAIWGEKYIDSFLRFGLTSMLSNSNQIKELEIKHIFVTNEQSKEIIEYKIQKMGVKFNYQIIVSKAIERLIRLERIFNLKFDKYTIHTHGFNIIVKELKEGDLYIPNYGDFIWGERTFSEILKIFDNSEIDFIATHPLTIDENQLLELSQKIEENLLSISSKELISRSLSSASWWYEQYQWASSKTTDYLSLMYWKTHSRSYIFRGFHIHPIAIRYRNHLGEVIPKIRLGTLDGYYLPYQLQKNNWKIFFASDVYKICLGTWTNRTKSEYKKNGGNYIKKLQRHIEANHSKQDIENSNYFIVIDENPEVARINKVKFEDISRQNIIKVVENLELVEDIQQKSVLEEDIKFIESLEKVSQTKYLINYLRIATIKLIFTPVIKLILFLIRRNLYTKRRILMIFKNILVKFYIKRIRMILFLQRFLNKDIIAPKILLENQIDRLLERKIREIPKLGNHNIFQNIDNFDKLREEKKNFRKVNNNFFKYISGKIFEKEFIMHHKKKRVKFAKFK